MKEYFEKIKEKIKKIINSEGFKAFCLIYLIGLVCFCIEAAPNSFTLPMGGDYTLQTYSFYSQGYNVFWNFIKTGEFSLFDFSNFLGANYLGTQSFYYVFSPLFYLLCLWPSKYLFQGIFFHMVFKFALGGFFMYLLLRKYFHVSFNLSWVGGFIYAFSGWTLFYLWFHFGDVMAFLPLFIMGIEKCLKERKGWLLGLSTLLCGLANYLFLVNFCIFGVLYALYRWIYIYGINKKRGFSIKERYGVLLQGIVYVAAGLLMACICLLPSLEVVMTATRTQTSSDYLLELLKFAFINPTKNDNVLVIGEAKALKDIFVWGNIKDLFNILFVWQDRSIGNMSIPGKTNIGYILSNWLFMNVNCWDNILFDNSKLDNALGGFFITTPLTMLLIPSIINAVKTKRPWTIFGVIICLALPFFPITSHIAFAFTNLYGRWEIWIVIIGILFIIPTLDNFEKQDRRVVTISLIVNYILAFIAYKISKDVGKLPTGDIKFVFGKEIPGLLLIVICQLVLMAIVWAIYRFKLFKPVIVKKIMTIIIVVEIGATTVITIKGKSYYNWDYFYATQPYYEELKDVVKEIQKEDDEFYRIMNVESTRGIMNLPSELNYNGASTFNSTYNFELDDFKKRSRFAYGGSWTMGNHEKRYWLDQYIGTKYYIIDKTDPNNDNGEFYRDRTEKFDGRVNLKDDKQEYALNLGWNYELYKSYDYFDVYKNNNFNGIGYTVDNIISSVGLGVTSRYSTWYEELYSFAAVIEEADLEYVQKKADNVTLINNFKETAKTLIQSNFDLYFSPREDMSYWKAREDGNPLKSFEERKEYQISSLKPEEFNKYLATTQRFFHCRWINRADGNDFYGDQIILKAKNEKIAPQASEDNQAYIAMNFKLGPKVLISLYNGDTLVTQDAHMNAGTLNAYNSEWKIQRGFYVNQPVDKIVIEFISDTTYEQAFPNKTSKMMDIDFRYSYQNDIEERQKTINTNSLKDVKYKNNQFTFKTDSLNHKVAVTNIPYDSGWTLKMNGAKRDIFKVNGGFIGFITDDKEASYELSYFTPNLKEGLILSGGGLLFFIALAFVYKNAKSSILLCENQLVENYMKKKEEDEEKYLKELPNKIKETLKIFKEKIIKLFKKK